MIVRLVIGVLLVAWGLYSANLFFRKQGNRTTSAIAALVLFLLGVGLTVHALYFHLAGQARSPLSLPDVTNLSGRGERVFFSVLRRGHTASSSERT